MHVEVIGPHVREGHYDLIDGKGEIILPQVWETVVTPGMSLTMHMWPIPEPPKAPAFEPRRGGPPPPPPGGWKSGLRPVHHPDGMDLQHLPQADTILELVASLLALRVLGFSLHLLPMLILRKLWHRSNTQLNQ